MSWPSGHLCRACPQHLGVSPRPSSPYWGRDAPGVAPGGACEGQGGTEPWTSKFASFSEQPRNFPSQLWCGGENLLPWSAHRAPNAQGFVCWGVLWASNPSGTSSASLCLPSPWFVALHSAMWHVQGITGEYWNSWAPQYTNGYHELIVCGQWSISPQSPCGKQFNCYHSCAIQGILCFSWGSEIFFRNVPGMSL